MKRKTNLFLLSSIFTFLFSFQIASADMIVPGFYNIGSIMMLILIIFYALIPTVLIESIIAYSIKFRGPNVFKTIMLANAISVPFLYLLLKYVSLPQLNRFIVPIIGEIGVIFFEAWLFRKRFVNISAHRSYILSTVINVGSVGIGLLLLLIL